MVTVQYTNKGNNRAISPVIGVILLVVITVLLVSVSAVTFVSLGQSGTEAATMQGMGTFDFDQAGETGNVSINPESVRGADSAQFHLRINGRDVYQWDGHSEVVLSCMVPGDRMTVVSVTDSGQSAVVQEQDFTSATVCPNLDFADRFQYALVGPDEDNLKKVEVGDEVAFGLTIDPDGPGPDPYYGWASADPPRADNISLGNDWHHVEAYTHGEPIEGLEPPVWVFVLTDNVHWPDVPSGTSVGWDDSPASIGYTINGNYSLESGPDGREIRPDSEVYYDDIAANRTDEPTNDIYMVFKPDCPTSKLRLVAQQGGYNNTIYLNDEMIVEDTADLGNSGTDIDPPLTYDAPGVCND